MILGKDQGNFDKMYSVFKHESWFSWHMADLIFPFFLFMVGSSIYFAFRKVPREVENSEEKDKALRSVTSRTIKLFLVGVLLNVPLSGFRWETLRWMGILQRIAICYGCVAFLFLFVNSRVIQYALVSVLFLLHTSLLYGLIVPNCLISERLTRACSAQSYLDTMILGGKHLYFHLEYDPEGILSTLMATINTFAGLEAARLTSSLRYVNQRILWCFLIGSSFVGIEILLVDCFPDSVPISKPLWTASFLFLTVGCSFWCLSFCGLWAKVTPRLVQPCLWVGRNSFFLFAASFLLDYAALLSIQVSHMPLKQWLYRHSAVTLLGDTEFASLSFASVFTLFWVVIAWILYRKKLFIKI
ncbi:heparan-alpha-glucosaminide N-acetyltransferase isoform 1 [Galdieria sulphuraria]|uniref:Heparan-alpha-glucosaminide N-acetyltransferase isoform 1 n=1 Tax=Galdieria sulphuraria TaxID=130081 RepID=M2W0K7_GALSU|nr:heparan-alpha-glucosaminide N-acetyltransferase isoform 1 [Galdieria sulphuraria]EME29141.1 heparan-alpha-glucosaminide N-acetyltransferase isoform 1 [Galdieria sulphuraria]|eukprot:XP_005705661.1 heparan-alpha-glucosaminide N-acetyltransferase isoform 1 [Galdieria sulphuraria]